MMGAFKIFYWFIMTVLSGVIAAKLTIPLMASWFGIQLTITGSSAIVGMYMYLLSSVVVAIGLMVSIAVVGGIIAFFGWCIYEWITNKNE